MPLRNQLARLILLSSVLPFAVATHAETAAVPEAVRQAANTYFTKERLEAPIRLLILRSARGTGAASRSRLGNSTSTTYHQPADKLDDSWNFDGVIEDAQLAMLSTWLIAQTDAMPVWKPGDEFESTRKRALAEIGR